MSREAVVKAIALARRITSNSPSEEWKELENLKCQMTDKEFRDYMVGIDPRTEREG